MTPDIHSLREKAKAADDLVERLKNRVVHDPFDDRIQRSDTLCLQAATRITELTRERDEAREAALEEAENAANEACWKHGGEDAYSQGMDAGAIHQTKACATAIRDLRRAAPTYANKGEPT